MLIKNLQELRDYLMELKNDVVDHFVDTINDVEFTSDFKLGRLYGTLTMLDEIDCLLRNSLKYNDDVE